MNEEKLLSTEEVAKWLNCHRATIVRMAQRGEMPSYKLGRVLRFKRVDVEQWLEKHKSTSAKNI